MPRPQRPRRKSVTRYYTPDGKRCTPSTPGARKVTEQSRTWFASIGGKDVPLKTEDEAEAWVRLRKLQREKADTAAGIRTPQQDAASLELTVHLAAYLDHLRAKGNTEAHVLQIERRVKAVLEGASLNRWTDLDPDRVGKLLAAWRKEPGKGKKVGSTMGAQTSNHYAGAVKGFAGWLAKKLKLAHPLAELSKVGTDADRRHVRRALSQEEFGRLIAAAESGRTLAGLTGPARAMLYIVAAYTGLRASALASLTAGVLELTGEPPTLTLAAGANKSRKARVWPLHAEVAAQLRGWLAGKPAAAKLWPGRWAVDLRGAELMRADLEAAGIPYEDAQGRVYDLHALRGQYGTNLARAGVSLAAAQKLLGHASPTTTAKHYTHLETEDLAREVAKLPPPPKPPQT